MRALVVMLALSTAPVAFADATVPPAPPAPAKTSAATKTGTLRGNEPFVIEVQRPVTLVQTRADETETVAFDTLGFVDATLSTVEPRGGLTIVKRPTALQRAKRSK